MRMGGGGEVRGVRVLLDNKCAWFSAATLAKTLCRTCVPGHNQWEGKYDVAPLATNLGLVCLLYCANRERLSAPKDSPSIHHRGREATNLFLVEPT